MTTIYKAQPIGGQIISDLDLKAIKPVPEMLGDKEIQTGWEKRWRDFYAAQGKTIADSLYASLPGGTLDALLVEMLDRKRSILSVMI